MNQTAKPKRLTEKDILNMWYSDLHYERLHPEDLNLDDHLQAKALRYYLEDIGELSEDHIPDFSKGMEIRATKTFKRREASMKPADYKCSLRSLPTEKKKHLRGLLFEELQTALSFRQDVERGAIKYHVALDPEQCWGLINLAIAHNRSYDFFIRKIQYWCANIADKLQYQYDNNVKGFDKGKLSPGYFVNWMTKQIKRNSQ